MSTSITSIIIQSGLLGGQGGYQINEWNTATRTSGVLVSPGSIYLPGEGVDGSAGVAVDGSGNVYFANAKANAVMEWTASTQTAGTLASVGLNGPRGVAVDAAGNVYIADSSFMMFSVGSVAARSKSGTRPRRRLSTLVSTGLMIHWA